jgi:hypothetical protein
MIASLTSMACGAFLIWMLYGFASMTDPDVQGAARDSAVWGKVTGDGMFPVGILLIVAGAWLAFSKPKRPA